MPHHPDLDQTVAIYAEAPDTPAKPSRRDWAVAQNLLDSGISLNTFIATVLLASLRRKLRPPDETPLEAIRSLAYFKPLARYLHENPLPQGYIEYLDDKFREFFPENKSPFDVEKLSKRAVHRQDPALFDSR